MRATVLLLLSVSTAPAFAEDGRDGPDILVNGRPLGSPPGSSAYGEAVIPRERLEASPSGRVEDVLRDIPGFSQFRRSDSRSANPSTQGANLRSIGGNAASRALILLDGVPMADPFFGSIPYSAIVPDRLAAIRVTRGGGAGVFGAGAVAGVIQMDSAARSDLALLSAAALYGSRDAQEVSASISPNLGDGFISLSGRYERGDGFDTTPVAQRVAATVPARYQSWSASLRAVAPLGSGAELQGRVLIYRDDRTLRFRGADSHMEGLDASIRIISRGEWQADALTYVQVRDFSNIVISANSFRKALDQRRTPTLGLGGKIELRPPVGARHVLRVGIDTRYAAGDVIEEAYDGGLAANPVTARRHGYGRQHTLGAFVEEDWTVGDVILTMGLRADRWTIGGAYLTSRDAAGNLTQDLRYPDRGGWQANGRAGAAWKAAPGLSLRAAAYTGFRPPTLNELYRGFTVFPITTNANPDLRPERLHGAEVGIDVTSARGAVAAGLTIFTNRLNDAIANVTQTPTIRVRRNVDAIAAQGAELGASAKAGPFQLDGALAYTLARVRAPGTPLAGLRPAQSTRFSATTTLAWIPRRDMRMATTIRYAGPQYEDDLNVDHIPGALTVDGYVRVPLGAGIAIIGRAENILDATVYTRRTSSPTLSEDLGTPRTFWLGLQAGI